MKMGGKLVTKNCAVGRGGGVLCAFSLKSLERRWIISGLVEQQASNV